MECVLCNYRSNIKENLKQHYEDFHNVDKNNVFFKKLMLQSKNVSYRRKCNICNEFVLANKAEHDFLRHYSTKINNGNGNENKDNDKDKDNQKPLTLTRLGSISKIEVSFKEHSSYYDFYNSEALVDSFLAQVKHLVPRNDIDMLIRAGFSIENVQPILNNDYSKTLTQTRYWSTEPFQSKSVNDFVIFKLREAILKRVINNRLSGSAWHFNKFNYLNVKIVNVSIELLK